MHAEGRLGSRAVARKAAARSVEVRTRQGQHRASRIAQDLFERHRDEVEKALLDALRNGTRTQKIRAAETLTKLALSGERIDTSAAKVEHEARSRDELIALMADKLSNGPAASLLARHLAERNGGEVIEGEAVEIAS